jgi:hypothetical protein
MTSNKLENLLHLVISIQGMLTLPFMCLEFSLVAPQREEERG